MNQSINQNKKQACSFDSFYFIKPSPAQPDRLTVDEHLQAGGTGPPGEVKLAVGQIRAMTDDGRLPSVELRARAVEAQHPAVPCHHQTHPVHLGRESSG